MYSQRQTEDDTMPMDHAAHNMGEDGSHSSWQHWGMMILCCLPMIALFALLVLGVWR